MRSGNSDGTSNSENSSGQQQRSGYGYRRFDNNRNDRNPRDGRGDNRRSFRSFGGGDSRRSSFGQPDGGRERGPGSDSLNQGEKNIPSLSSTKLRVIPLGGHGEIGRNCWIYEYSNEIILLDAGVGFAPHGVKGGIDLLLPNFEYLKERKSSIKALVLSNPHEEFSGNAIEAIRSLEIKSVYMPKLLYQSKKAEFDSIEDLKISFIEHGEEVKIGNNFVLDFFRTAFCTPDAYSILVQAAQKIRVFYAGAFKVDHNSPISSFSTDLTELADKVNRVFADLFISPSVNVESSNYSTSEASVFADFEKLISKSKGKTIILTCDGYLHRLQVLAKVARKLGKKFYLLGKGLTEYFTAAKALNIFEDAELIIPVESPNAIDLKNAVIIQSSSEGKILQPLFDIISGNSDVPIENGDIVILSANQPLGTARLLAGAMDKLIMKGIRVFTPTEAKVHVSPFGGKEELKLLFNFVHPKYFLPANGETRQLVLHAEMIGKCEIDPQNVIIADNGSVIDLDPIAGKVGIVGKIDANPIFFNESMDSCMANSSIRERQTLAEEGMVLIGLAIDKGRNKLIAGPEIITLGSSFSDSEAWQELEILIKSDVKLCVEKLFKTEQKDLGLMRRLIYDIFNKRMKEKFGGSSPILSISIQEEKEEKELLAV